MVHAVATANNAIARKACHHPAIARVTTVAALSASTLRRAQLSRVAVRWGQSSRLRCPSGGRPPNRRAGGGIAFVGSADLRQVRDPEGDHRKAAAPDDRFGRSS